MNQAYYKNPNMFDAGFLIIASEATAERNTVFVERHWHKQIEMLLILEGEAVFKCNSQTIYLKAGELGIVNSNEIHFFESLGSEVTYCWICVDDTILQSYTNDSCEVKYILPIIQNLILFENKVSGDAKINALVVEIVHENKLRQYGYELDIKASLFKLFVLLLRNHPNKVLTERQSEKRATEFMKLDKALKYISNNYHEDITTHQLAKIANFHENYFSGIFRKATGMTVKDYINRIRLNEAEELLKTTNMSISEIAAHTSFGDINYFSRVFRKIKQVSPTLYRNSLRYAAQQYDLPPTE